MKLDSVTLIHAPRMACGRRGPAGATAPLLVVVVLRENAGIVMDRTMEGNLVKEKSI